MRRAFSIDCPPFGQIVVGKQDPPGKFLHCGGHRRHVTILAQCFLYYMEAIIISKLTVDVKNDATSLGSHGDERSGDVVVAHSN